MPWVSPEMCTGCSDCIEECPSGAIWLTNDRAFINMEYCIRCGRCHELCPEEAVRHDGERLGEEIRANVERTREYMDTCARHFEDALEASKCLERWIKHYNRIKTTAEKTIVELESLQKSSKH